MGAHPFAASQAQARLQIGHCFVHVNVKLVGRLGTANRGFKQHRFTVLKETSCPAVLVETAFLSNPDDRALLTDPDQQQQFAQAIAAAVARFPEESRISFAK